MNRASIVGAQHSMKISTVQFYRGRKHGMKISSTIETDQNDQMYDRSALCEFCKEQTTETTTKNVSQKLTSSLLTVKAMTAASIFQKKL